MDEFIYWVGMLGIAVFAISGALAAMRRGLDPFGLVVLAVVTAIGGGTIRDIILDVPVFWVRDPTWLYVAVGTAALTPLWGRYLESRMSVLMLADACGLALFAVTGTEKALSTGASPVIAITMGVLTAAAGGVIRDILCNEIPLVLQKELYALPAIMGGASLVLLRAAGVDHALSVALSCAVTLVLRVVAIKYSLSLPPAGRKVT